ncbi:MAG: DUF4332 domain-containing protein [Saprospiraceae bacterium]|nr:DUF4332 domain-containing protein [Saprospiraceae bacterium]MBP7679886.1 DUF4332 domain-containing protein [Saprospiraceae bacterium]
MANKIVEIEGIGPKYAEALGNAGIKTVQALLKAGADKKGRKAIAEKTGISDDHILRWVNMADLFRIKGVAEEFSDLLERAGVDTVKELRNRKPENLHAALLKANNDFKLVRRAPTDKEVQSWVAQAKELAPMVTH